MHTMPRERSESTVCILHKKLNLEDKAQDEGEIGLTCKDLEIRVFNIEQATSSAAGQERPAAAAASASL